MFYPEAWPLIFHNNVKCVTLYFYIRSLFAIQHILMQSYCVLDIDELEAMRNELQRQITQTSQRLIRHLKSKDRRQAKVQKHCDVITAILQAASLKRRKLMFTISDIWAIIN